jgi:O-antigen/teichoic acid export membrane protein
VSTLVSTLVLVSAGFGVGAVFLGQTLGSVAGLLVALRAVYRSYGKDFDGKWLRVLLSFSIPLVPASLGVVAALYLDRLVIGAFLTLEDVAQFAVGYRIAAAVGLVMTALHLALTPLIYANHRAPEAPAQLAVIFRVAVGLGLSMWLVLALMAPEAVSIVATGAYGPAAAVIPLQAPAIIMSAMLVFAPGLAIAGRTGIVAGLSLSGAALNLLLNVLLVPTFGISGAATSTLISTVAVFALMMWRSEAIYPTRIDFRRPLAGVLLAGAAIAVSGVPFDDPAPLVWRVVILSMALAALSVMGLVRPRSWLVSLVSRQA